jgi:hypothetical protein
MRNRVAETIAVFFAVVALSSTVVAQTQPQQPVKQFPTGFVQQADEYVAAGIPKMPDPPGPAPKRDLTGAWAGPI